MQLVYLVSFMVTWPTQTWSSRDPFDVRPSARGLMVCREAEEGHVLEARPFFFTKDRTLMQMLSQRGHTCWWHVHSAAANSCQRWQDFLC
jgi:hypothetical protein